MKSCIVVGAKGFIGSAVAAEARARGYDTIAIDLDNLETSRGLHADLLIHAAGNSRKFLDDQDPLAGFDLSVTSLMKILHDFSFDFFLHLSSGAVYPDEANPSTNAENTPLAPARMTRYGFHKWLAEQLVCHYAPHHLIVRMGGFVGPGLRKNAVRDILTRAPLFVHPDSEFQFMDTRDLAKAIFTLYENGCPLPLLNLSALGVVTVRRIAELAGYPLPASAESLPIRRAELNLSAAADLLPLPHTAETVARFICDVQSGKLVLP